MDRLHRLAAAALTVCSGVSFGVLAMTGVVAAVLFPMMKSLDPTLPAFSAYSGPHWSLAAGLVAERVFNIGFVAGGVALSLSLAGALTLGFTRGAGSFPIVRLALVLVTLGLFLTHVGWLQPRMDAAASEYRRAALQGDSELAAGAKSRFDGMHPIASNLIVGSTLSALALFTCAAWSATRPRRDAAQVAGGGA